MTTPADRLAAMIAEHGFAVQAVFPGSGSPGFAYTVGLAMAGLPELVIVGLPPEIAHQLLSGTARAMIEGSIPTDFDVVPRRDGIGGIAENLLLSLRLLPDTRELHEEWVVQAGQVLGARHFRTVQIVWPDRTGRFPEDDDCTPYASASQNAIHDWRETPGPRHG